MIEKLWVQVPAGTTREFTSPELSLCWLLFGVHSTLVLPQWHVKDPSHSAKSAGGRLHLNVHTALTQRSRSGLTMPLSRHSVGIYIRKRAHTQLVRKHSVTVVSARWATVDWSRPKEWNECARANLHFVKKKKFRRGINGWTFSQNPHKRGKGHHLHLHWNCVVKALSVLHS